jgi:hypothetical protein
VINERTLNTLNTVNSEKAAEAAGTYHFRGAGKTKNEDEKLKRRKAMGDSDCGKSYYEMVEKENREREKDIRQVMAMVIFIKFCERYAKIREESQFPQLNARILQRATYLACEKIVHIQAPYLTPQMMTAGLKVAFPFLKEEVERERGEWWSDEELVEWCASRVELNVNLLRSGLDWNENSAYSPSVMLEDFRSKYQDWSADEIAMLMEMYKRPLYDKTKRQIQNVRNNSAAL